MIGFHRTLVGRRLVVAVSGIVVVVAHTVAAEPAAPPASKRVTQPPARADAAAPVTADAPPTPGTEAHLDPAPQSPADRLRGREYYRLRQSAEEAFRESDFAEAAEMYRTLAEQFPYDGEVWLRLARCQYQLQQYRPCIDSYQKVMALGVGTSFVNATQLARLHALLDDEEAVYDWLARALAYRHEDRPVLATDPRFEELRSSARFRELAGLPPEGPMSRDQRWRYDLAFLTAEARRMHVGPDRPAESEAFRAAVAALEARIPDLSDDQIAIEMQKIIVLLGDGHSRVRFENRGAVAMPRIPLAFYVFADGLYVIDADEARAELIGARVLRFGDVPVAEAMRRLETVVSRDNPMGIRWNGPAYLTILPVLVNLGLAEDASGVELAVIDRDGSQRTVAVPAGQILRRGKLFAPKQPQRESVPRYLRRRGEAHWFEPLPDDGAVYVQFNQVRDEAGETLEQFGLRLREYLDSHDFDVLIVDVRHNSGGNTYLYPELLKTLVHFETSRPGARIFAIIGRDTYSAAMNFTTDVDRLTEAIFVGEPTGARPNFPGESTTTLLPFSKLGVSISTRYHQHSYPTDERIWIAPEVPAELSSADYFANRDPAMEAVLEIVREDAQRDRLLKSVLGGGD